MAVSYTHLLAENTDNYFKEKNECAEEDLIFTLSDQEFDQVKQSIETVSYTHLDVYKRQEQEWVFSI